MNKTFISGLLVGITVAIVPTCLYYYQLVRELRNSSAPTEVTKAEDKYSMGVYVTAMHLPDKQGYELLSEDAERDVAYYKKTQDNLTTIELEDVNIEGLDGCTVVKSEPGVFYVTTTTPDRIVNGMSGTRVYLKSGEAIGFVDALVAGQQIKCMTLE